MKRLHGAQCLQLDQVKDLVSLSDRWPKGNPRHFVSGFSLSNWVQEIVPEHMALKVSVMFIGLIRCIMVLTLMMSQCLI